MLKQSKTDDARVMTRLVQIATGVSAMVAAAALVIAMWPQAGRPTSLLAQPVVRGGPLELATPYVPLEDTIYAEIEERPARREIPPKSAPDPY